MGGCLHTPNYASHATGSHNQALELGQRTLSAMRTCKKSALGTHVSMRTWKESADWDFLMESIAYILVF